MFEMGLKDEFECWLENREWTEEESKQIENLNEEDKTNIVVSVMCDEELTQEMFRCFEWYLMRYLAIKGDK